MSAAREVNDAGRHLLYLEAHYLDTQRWDEWLELFVEDCEFWVPAWKAEHELTSDPKRELSLVYIPARSGLEDRVWRVRSGRSVASMPMPRTQRSITNVLVKNEGTPEAMTVLSNWTVHMFTTKDRESHVFFGRAEHDLVQRDGVWKIRRKKVVLLNDRMPAALDFYCL